jgi:hypothetical protein
MSFVPADRPLPAKIITEAQAAVLAQQKEAAQASDASGSSQPPRRR